MKKIVVTGARGFIGRNLVTALQETKEYDVIPLGSQHSEAEFQEAIQTADFIVHLAGVNRPQNLEEFHHINVGVTEQILTILQENNKKTPILFASSTQAQLDNEYGKSKKAAEEILTTYQQQTSASLSIFRLPNVFGKGCRPNYNSAVATFCHNIASDKEVWISDDRKGLDLVYIDDVIAAFMGIIADEVPSESTSLYKVTPVYRRTLGDIVSQLKSFRNMRNNLLIPNLEDRFTKVLYSTYLSYLQTDDFSYSLDKKEDNRGWLAELVKSPSFGQLFVSTSHEGIIRGNHYHHTKVEKFIVVQGEALISFRKIDEEKVIEYTVTGDIPTVVDIPPGYTHSIENVGKSPLITLFWSNELFNPNNPDTYFCDVKKP